MHLTFLPDLEVAEPREAVAATATSTHRLPASLMAIMQAAVPMIDTHPPVQAAEAASIISLGPWPRRRSTIVRAPRPRDLLAHPAMATQGQETRRQWAYTLPGWPKSTDLDNRLRTHLELKTKAHLDPPKGGTHPSTPLDTKAGISQQVILPRTRTWHHLRGLGAWIDERHAITDSCKALTTS